MADSSSFSSSDDEYYKDGSSSLSSGSDESSGFSSSDSDSYSSSSSNDDSGSESDFHSSGSDTYGNMSSDESSEEDVSSDDGNVEDLDFEAKHARALKKWGVSTQDSTRDKAEKARVKKQTRAETAREGTAGDQATRESVVRKTWAEEVEGLSEMEVLAKLRELDTSRQKRSGERTEQLRQAQEHAREHGMKRVYVEALKSLVGIGLDLSASICLSPTQWSSLAHDVVMLYRELCILNEVTFATNEASPAAAVAAFVDSLHSNLNKGIKSADPYTEEYRERLQRLPELHALLLIDHAFLRKAGANDNLINRCLVSLIGQTYYMTDSVAAERWKQVFQLVPDACDQLLGPYFTFREDDDGSMPSNSLWIKSTIEEVVSRKTPDVEIDFTGMCYYIQNAAINRRLDEAREILSSTPLYEMAQTLDATEQIHYNRAICQVGLAAFREGNFQLASTILNDICANNKQRELLAQGISSNSSGRGGDGRGNDNGRSEQEKIERRRLLPAYLHLNLDMIESASNIYSILNSRTLRFRRILDYTEKSFVPPETSREIVFACGRKLYNGEYSEARKLLKSLKFWQSYDQPGMEGMLNPGSAAEVQEKILEKFKEIALICYFQRYAHVYNSFSAQDLADMFDLSKEDVYALVSRMILKKELNASWDAAGEVLYIQQNLCTPLQTLTLTTLKNVDTLFESTGV